MCKIFTRSIGGLKSVPIGISPIGSHNSIYSTRATDVIGTKNAPPVNQPLKNRRLVEVYLVSSQKANKDYANCGPKSET